MKSFLQPFSSLPLIQEGLLSVTKYVHKVLVNCLVKLAQEKSVSLIISLENQFLVFLRVAVLHRFYSIDILHEAS